MNAKPPPIVVRRFTASYDLVAWVSKRWQSGRFALLLREADILWTPEVEHAVQCVDGNRDLGRSTLIGARSQPITDDPFEAADVGLYQRSPVVAS